MTLKFETFIGQDRIQISALRARFLGSKQLPFSSWIDADPATRSGVAFLARLLKEGDAILVKNGMSVEISHEVAVSIPGNVAETIDMPPLAACSCIIESNGRIDQPETLIKIKWRDINFTNISPKRIGAFLNYGGLDWRLDKSVYQLIEAISNFNRTVNSDPMERIAAWEPVQSSLSAIVGDQVTPEQYLKSLTIYQAGSFALNVKETSNGPDFAPILMSRSKRQIELDETSAPEEGSPNEDRQALRDAESDALLPLAAQEIFEQRFRNDTSISHAYVLDRNKFIVLEPSLIEALKVTQSKRRGSEQDRREFVRNPRPFLTEALENEAAGSLFVETTQYSERVERLGLWEPPSLPWLAKFKTAWLPEGFELTINGEKVLITEPAEVLAEKIENAKASGSDSISIDGKEIRVETIEEALEAVIVTPTEHEAPDMPPHEVDPDPEERSDRQVLIIKDNLETADFLRRFQPRKAKIPKDFGDGSRVLTAPKKHQIEGFNWLIDAWTAGWPGVLLADDMGLGKTLQALAFLAWTRSNRIESGLHRGSARAPILVVAPTALLRTWIDEAQKHLVDDALGPQVEAFGSGLKHIKRPKSAGWSPEDALDLGQLRDAGWILTTYETLATYHRAFARVRYSVVVFDEMQKIKSPSTLNTNAAKSISADFVLGLTGTPVENRLEDLWCIMDRVADGFLGSLRNFNQEFGDASREQLERLKTRLEATTDGAPSVLKRRMKVDILEGLPTRELKEYPATMPSKQAETYANAILAAQSLGTSRGTMLEVIHRLRAISLHPELVENPSREAQVDFDSWAAQSARVSKTLELLDTIHARGEKALIFVESKVVQRLLATGLVSRYSLNSEPTIINGEVEGSKRQSLVNVFQQAPKGFDLMILSPRAAGVGLTITAANHVIHLSRWWNPAVEDQCNDRIYRIGQEKAVSIHFPMAVHPAYGEKSFDNKLSELMTRKRELSRGLLAPPENNEDIDTLFSGVSQVG